MQFRRVFAVAALGASILTSACTDRLPVPATRAPETFLKCAERPEGLWCQVHNPSLMELVIRPELYQNCRVRVVGYLSVELEDEMLYASRDAYDHGEQQSAIGLEFTAVQVRDYRGLQGRRVELEGTFHQLRVANVLHVKESSFRRGVLPAPPPVGVPR